MSTILLAGRGFSLGELAGPCGVRLFQITTDDGRYVQLTAEQMQQLVASCTLDGTIIPALVPLPPLHRGGA